MNLVEDVRKFIDQCEKTVFETRKSDLFWKTFDSLVEFVFSPLIIKGLPNRTLQLAIRIFKEAETVQVKLAFYFILNTSTFLFQFKIYFRG